MSYAPRLGPRRARRRRRNWPYCRTFSVFDVINRGLRESWSDRLRTRRDSEGRLPVGGLASDPPHPEVQRPANRSGAVVRNPQRHRDLRPGFGHGRVWHESCFLPCCAAPLRRTISGESRDVPTAFPQAQRQRLRRGGARLLRLAGDEGRSPRLGARALPRAQARPSALSAARPPPRRLRRRLSPWCAGGLSPWLLRPVSVPGRTGRETGARPTGSGSAAPKLSPTQPPSIPPH